MSSVTAYFGIAAKERAVVEPTDNQCPPSKRSIIGDVAGMAIVSACVFYPSSHSAFCAGISFIMIRFLNHQPKPGCNLGVYRKGVLSAALSGVLPRVVSAISEISQPSPWISGSLASTLFASSMTAGLLSNRGVSLRTIGKTALIAAVATAVFGASVYAQGTRPLPCVEPFVHWGIISGFYCFIICTAVEHLMRAR